MDKRAYNQELSLLAARSNGTIHDAICEWAYNFGDYPTLSAMARDGIVSHRTTAALAATRRPALVAA